MADGVLHQRLEDEVGNEGAERGGVNLIRDLEAVVEPRSLDLEIQREDLELPSEAHLCGRCAGQRQAKQVAKAPRSMRRLPSARKPACTRPSREPASTTLS